MLALAATLSAHTQSTLRIRVEDHQGRAIASATVQAGPQTDLTNDSGLVVFQNVAKWPVLVHFSAVGFRDTTFEVAMPDTAWQLVQLQSAAKELESVTVLSTTRTGQLIENAPLKVEVLGREELEEERRLFYVAITRAKKKLFLTYANTRYKFGSLTQNEPSRFIDEMPQDLLDRSYAGGGVKNQSSGWGSGSAFDRMRKTTTTEQKPERTFISAVAAGAVKGKEVAHTPSANFVPSDPAQLKEGIRVEHQKFGFGNVLKLEGSAHNPVATIKFDQNGEKKIMLNYAKLMIVNG